MAGEWQTLPAMRFCASVRDGTHDSPKPVEQGRYLVTSRHIIGGRLDLGNAYLISQSDFDAINKRSKVDKWDVLISMIGTVGEPCLVRSEPNFAIKNIGLFKSKGEAEGKWLFYYLRSPQAQQFIREQSRGTTQPYIPLGALRDFPITLPSDPKELLAIVKILNTLDEKIESNRCMNETLEAVIRVTFKSWFVDFDPVRAKVEGGRPLGMDAEMAALFPGSLEDSATGEVPKGWRITNLGEVAENPRRITNPETVSQSTPYIGLEHMPRRSVALAEWGRSEEVTSGKCAFFSGEILFGKLRPYFHKVGVAPIDGVCSTDIVVIKAKSPEWFGIILGYVSSKEFVDYSNAVSTGTKMPRTNWHDMARYEICLPDRTVAEKFTSLVQSFVKKIHQNIRESRTLATIRDTLLPKLISGELRIKDAERVVIEGT